ncbi:hypothetical protein BJ508DRAFT_324163 [Ascobolus immersus RN42]|uniref:Uncharacterized protein n=1 Tax=Ascobolus immersus RN42 TaxID=1160509 RepID=A0A3N4ICJ7_ASCIM|nr:hypothetical protein BJ508DRAFT_324163 [Ascobolus immersus RN42]
MDSAPLDPLQLVHAEHLIPYYLEQIRNARGSSITSTMDQLIGFVKAFSPTEDDLKEVFQRDLSAKEAFERDLKEIKELIREIDKLKDRIKPFRDIIDSREMEDLLDFDDLRVILGADGQRKYPTRVVYKKWIDERNGRLFEGRKAAEDFEEDFRKKYDEREPGSERRLEKMGLLSRVLKIVFSYVGVQFKRNSDRTLIHFMWCGLRPEVEVQDYETWIKIEEQPLLEEDNKPQYGYYEVKEELEGKHGAELPLKLEHIKAFFTDPYFRDLFPFAFRRTLVEYRDWLVELDRLRQTFPSLWATLARLLKRFPLQKRFDDERRQLAWLKECRDRNSEAIQGAEQFVNFVASVDNSKQETLAREGREMGREMKILQDEQKGLQASIKTAEEVVNSLRKELRECGTIEQLEEHLRMQVLTNENAQSTSSNTFRSICAGIRYYMLDCCISGEVYP